MIVPATDPTTWGPTLDAAAKAVAGGEAVILPTDTVYGIGCSVFSPSAVSAILAAKGRDRDAPPPVLIPSVASLGKVAYTGGLGRVLMNAFWPGPLTIIVESLPQISAILGTNGTVAVRVPGHPTARALLERTGPMAVTSANLTGETPAVTAEEAERSLGAHATMVLDGGRCPIGQASTIVDATGPLIRVVRFGAIGKVALEGVVGEDGLVADTGA
ncbi:MAG: threonylcarbamoyl-AMP synthase [Demequinaceae bacterium]|nr:threonylcarbamoyl-AMP synthase [Demequinaceae bacterium]